MSETAISSLEVGSEWRHICEPGVFVITKTTDDGWVIWTEKDVADAVEWVAPSWEFARVFVRTEQAAADGE